MTLIRFWQLVCYRPAALGVAFGLCVLVSGAARTDSVSVETAARLQAALSQFITQASTDDGAFIVLDRHTAKRMSLYPAGKHPLIIPFAGDFYVCMTMLDKEGRRLNVDFLLRPQRTGTAGQFIVVDTFVDARDLLERAIDSN